MADDEELRCAFDDVAESYDRARPEYPARAFDDLFDALRTPHYDPGPGPTSPRVVEIGPGTGQATGALLARGARVTAVEIGPRLAQFLRDKFRSDRLDVITGAFEDVELAPAHYDMVFAATSFHWLDPAVRVRKAAGLLARGGLLGTISTMQIRSEVDRGYFDRSLPLYEKYGLATTHTELPAEDGVTPGEAEEFRACGLLDDVIVHRYRWDQTYTSETYEHLVRSYSNTKLLAPVAREQFLAELRAFVDTDFDGVVVRPLVIALTMGRRPER